MADVIVTGASRGIGHALALALAGSDHRLLLVARDESRLTTLAQAVRERGGRAEAIPGDLSTVAGARALGERLAATASDAVLIHNAGLWPAERVLTPEGIEASFVVNHLAPLAMQAPLLAMLRRVMVVSAGLISLGRFDAERTPRGDDFSVLRTYCTTKLCFALAMRDVARAHPELDVVVLHPGVVNTDLGARRGLLGWLLSLAKRRFEPPDACAARLARVLARPRWSPPGEAKWLFEEREQPWPASAENVATSTAVRDVTTRLLSS
jgi:NAD(P)-dependent dehydrogenase (short-subunit alcohol dehydrogenase family)